MSSSYPSASGGWHSTTRTSGGSPPTLSSPSYLCHCWHTYTTMAIKERGVVVVANKTTTGLRGRLTPSPSPFRGFCCGRLTATDIKLMTFGESQKSISWAFLTLCQWSVMKFCATGAWSLSLSAGAGSYTLPNIPRGGGSHYHFWWERTNQTI